MKYEGHFLLWYIILMPFAKLGFPYYTTNIISWMITSVSVWLILDKAPFKFYKRVLLVFTFQLLYLYPIVSRCYCLIPLAIVLMCIFYKDRKEKPLRYLFSIVLLANTHVVMLGMVGIVILDYIFEIYKDSKNISVKDKNKRINCLIITIILLMISILPLIGCLETNQDLGTSNNLIYKVLIAIFHYPWVLTMQIFGFFMSNITMSLFILMLSFIWIFYEIKNYPFIYLKIFFCVMWQCLIYSFIYGSSLQRASTIVFIVLYFKWINTFKENKKINDIEKRILDIELKDIRELSSIFEKDQKLYYIYCKDKFNVGEDEFEYEEANLIEECVNRDIFKKLYSTEDNSLYKESYAIYEVNLDYDI